MNNSEMTLFGQLATNPLKFVSLCWPDMQLYDKQRDILVSLVENKETYVHAANELGKSRIAAIAAIWFFASRQPARVVSSSTTQAQLDSILWTEIRSLISKSRVKFPFEITALRVRKLDAGRNVLPLDYLVGHVTTNIESFQGHHLPNDKPRVLCVLDEASGIPDEFNDAADSWAHRKLVIGNPLSTTNFFYRLCKAGDVPDPTGRDKLLRKVIHIDGLDSPNVQLGLLLANAGQTGRSSLLIPGLLSYEEFVQRNQEWDEVKRTTRLHGFFYEGDQAMLFPAAWLDVAQQYDLELVGQTRKARAMGVDGAEGRDLTCWTIVDQHGVIKQVAKQTPDTTEVVQETLQLMDAHDIAPQCVVFDGGGGGKAIVDRLRQLDRPVQSVMFGSAPSETKTKCPSKRRENREVRQTYRNRRAELYGNCRRLLDPEREDKFALPHNAHELRQELAILPLLYDGEGRMYLPPKDRTAANSGQLTLRSLLGRSPDRADSLVLAIEGLKRNPPRLYALPTAEQFAELERQFQERLGALPVMPTGRGATSISEALRQFQQSHVIW